jgi:hypothetical protein
MKVVLLFPVIKIMSKKSFPKESFLNMQETSFMGEVIPCRVPVTNDTCPLGAKMKRQRYQRSLKLKAQFTLAAITECC